MTVQKKRYSNKFTTDMSAEMFIFNKLTAKLSEFGVILLNIPKD